MNMLKDSNMFFFRVLLPAFLLATFVTMALVALEPLLASESTDEVSISFSQNIVVWVVFSAAFIASFVGTYVRKNREGKYLNRIHFLQSIWFLAPVWLLAFYLVRFVNGIS